MPGSLGTEVAALVSGRTGGGILTVLENIDWGTVTADGRRPRYAVCAATQKFTEDKSRGYLGAYSRQIHTDIFEIRPDGTPLLIAWLGLEASELCFADGRGIPA